MFSSIFNEIKYLNYAHYLDLVLNRYSWRDTTFTYTIIFYKHDAIFKCNVFSKK